MSAVLAHDWVRCCMPIRWGSKVGCRTVANRFYTWCLQRGSEGPVYTSQQAAELALLGLCIGDLTKHCIAHWPCF